MNITHAGKVTARAGEHVLRHVAPLMPHEFIQMQTIAANLGSMLTPIGNPQNLYLYGKSGMSIGGFVLLMLPYTLVSLLLLLSGFTAETQALIIGTNLGGLGTLIASMASLISYRQIAREGAATGEEAVFWVVHPIQSDLPCDSAGRVVFAPLSVVSGSAMNVCFLPLGKHHPHPHGHPCVLHCLPSNLIFTICIFIPLSPTLARNRKKPLTEESFKSLYPSI